jgi:hypothetical protein
VLTVWGPPFGTTDQATARLVHRLNAAVCCHYGHAGPRFVQHLLKNRALWPTWRERFEERKSQYLRKADADPVAGRMAAPLALLDIAGLLVHDALELPWVFQSPVRTLWSELVNEAGEADRGKEALSFAHSWAVSHRREFHDKNDGSCTEERQPNAGWAGRWDSDGKLGLIAFATHRLTDLLRLQGYDVEGILRAWKDRGWIEADRGSKRLTKKVRIGKVAANCYAIRLDAIEDVVLPGGIEQDE